MTIYVLIVTFIINNKTLDNRVATFKSAKTCATVLQQNIKAGAAAGACVKTKVTEE